MCDFRDMTVKANHGIVVEAPAELLTMQIPIWDIKFRSFHNNPDKMRAVVSFNYGYLAVHDAKIVEEREGRLFLAMPNRKLPKKNKDAEIIDYIHTDVVHPFSAIERQRIEDTILHAYKCCLPNHEPDQDVSAS